MVGGCPSDDVLAAHFVGELAEADRDAVRAHLDACEACREVLVVIAKGTPSERGKEPTLVAIRRERALHSPRLELPPRFVVERLLGQGGMGRVFAARDTELDRPVAVKVMRGDLAGAQMAERLLRESRAMARLNHPGVVTVYDVGRHEGNVFIAMELIAGVTLQHWLRARPRTWREIASVFVRAGEGLAAAHAAGLVHRDIKPENILLALDGDRVQRVAVSDFGVALAAHEEVRSRSIPEQRIELTQTGIAIGTPAYMAPEQLEGRDVDARADVFSFGVSLWEALYGERPYRGTTLAELVAAMKRGAPAPPKRSPRHLARAVHEAIDPDRERRPTLAALLARIDPARRERTRNLIAVAAIGVIGLGGVAMAVVPRFFDHAGPPPPALCSDAGLANVWNAVARQSIAAALRALPGDVAAGVAERTLQAGDTFASRWIDTRTAVCALTDPPRRLAATTCLDARRKALAKLVAVAPTLVPRDRIELDDMIGALPSVELCKTDAVLRDIAPALQQRAAMVEARLGEIDVLTATGELAKARDELAALAPEVTAIGAPALSAQHLRARAVAVGDTDPDAKIALSREAANEAGKAGRDDMAATAWLAIAREYTDTKNDAKRAEDALGLADSAIARGGEDRALRARYLLSLAKLRILQAKFDDAKKLLGDLRERALRDAPTLIIGVEDASIALLTEADRYADAIDLANKVIADRTKRLGASHETTIQVHNLLSNALLMSGAIDKALAETHTALELARRGYGPDSDTYALGLRNLGVSLSAVGKPDEALAALREARRLLVVTRGARSFMVGNTFQEEGTTLAESGKPADAIPLYEQALSIYHDTVGDKHVQTAELALSYASTLAQLDKDIHIAVEKTREAVELFRGSYGEDSPRYAYARAVLGEALIHAKDKRAARVELEAAVAIYAHAQFEPTLVAAANFNLAQALTVDPTQHARAVSLAKTALAVFEKDPQWADAVRHIKQWLAKGGRD